MSYEGSSSLSVHHETPSFMELDPINALHRAKLDADPDAEESICTDDELLEIVRAAKRVGKGDGHAVLMGTTLEGQWIDTRVPARIPHSHHSSGKYESDAERSSARTAEYDASPTETMGSSYSTEATSQATNSHPSAASGTLHKVVARHQQQRCDSSQQ
ncbi:hypothetical protein IE81DRAFT_349376 [Ceraceosorus guamensis]|uniref:Uncharacterized protein n=1 Tax=Ceraceosorus guamensis TaxID=1522189 RepID=A0A316VVE5_9BASI|nr:hypothetical protein IE81DRAFT_349376 [Ceraceosorus guamensis]PWN40281.1 hypothetical protein IE81DRAFT_349376 [Ceraceosorus guamensis]